LTVQAIKTAEGVEISALVAGDGPLVVLMHGWPELGVSWRHQIQPLVAAGYRVAAPDMRGYGASSKPAEVAAYSLDLVADDMAAVAGALGAKRWVAVGHDWGAPAAWRSAQRFPEAVAAVFSLSVPHQRPSPVSAAAGFDIRYPDRFFYARYFQAAGPAEAELERDPRAALKKMFFALSGDAPASEWIKLRPRDAALLAQLVDPPPGPLSFMSDAELDLYADAYARGGFFGPLSWYRNMDANAEQGRAYPGARITQPAGFLAGEKEIVLAMSPGGLAEQRELCDDLRVEKILPGAGHWIQQERPAEVSAALISFLDGVRDRL
jgi:pimeloyl-ACP methyl ester carboxylesterase